MWIWVVSLDPASLWLSIEVSGSQLPAVHQVLQGYQHCISSLIVPGFQLPFLRPLLPCFRPSSITKQEVRLGSCCAFVESTCVSCLTNGQWLLIPPPAPWQQCRHRAFSSQWWAFRCSLAISYVVCCPLWEHSSLDFQCLAWSLLSVSPLCTWWRACTGTLRRWVLESACWSPFR